MKEKKEKKEADGKRIWGFREADAEEIVRRVMDQLTEQLKSHPLKFPGDVDSFLELLYFTFTEYISIETPEFREKVNELSGILRGLVETDEEADRYMSTVYDLCADYERQSYMQGLKVGVRLMMEMME